MKDTVLLADIGNTSLDLCLYQNEILFPCKISKDQPELLKKKIGEYLEKKPFSFALISSVNHEARDTLTTLLEEKKIPYEAVNPEMMDTYNEIHHIKVDNTSFLGSDLYCDILAYPAPCIIIDLGTVGKILFLDKNKVFHGAAIFPDIKQFASLMHQDTDLLGEYDLLKNPPVVSLKTKECISSGIINGISGLIVSMTKRIKKDYNAKESEVYLTGGNSTLVKDILPYFEMEDFHYDPYLPLRGLSKLIPVAKKEK